MKNWLSARLVPLAGPLSLLFIALVLPLAVFGKIADRVEDGRDFGFDDRILQSIHNHASPAGDTFFIWVARWGGVYGLLPLSVLILAYLAFTHQKTKCLFWGLSLGGTCILNLTTKHIFGRARPELWLSPAPEKDFSFPSGHAMLSTAFFLTLIVLAWPTKWRLTSIAVGLVSIGLIVLSRLYLGVHYPSDIIGGICASLAWTGGLTWLMENRQQLPFLKRFSRTARTRVEL